MHYTHQSHRLLIIADAPMMFVLLSFLTLFHAFKATCKTEPEDAHYYTGCSCAFIDVIFIPTTAMQQ